MSGVKSIWKIMQSLKRKGYIYFESENGKASVITILKPTTSDAQFENQPTISDAHTMNLSDTHHVHNVNGSQRAKESIKETIKEKGLFFVFKEKYPAFKFDGDVEAAWNSISYEHQQLVVGVMQYQLTMWDEPNFIRKYIPKASNYLLKQLYLDDAVKKPYEDKLRREKEAVERRRYIKMNEENSASSDEIKEIMGKWIKTE